MKSIDQYLNEGYNFIPAVVSFLVKDDKVLLGLRKKVSFGLGENLISGIGGKVGDTLEVEGETCDQAIIREIQEEIGVTATKYVEMGRVRFIFVDKPKWSQDVRIYLVKEWEGNPSETEAIKPEWYSISNLPTNQMWADNAFWVPRILGGETVDLVFLYGSDGKITEIKEK